MNLRNLLNFIELARRLGEKQIRKFPLLKNILIFFYCLQLGFSPAVKAQEAPITPNNTTNSTSPRNTRPRTLDDLSEILISKIKLQSKIPPEWAIDVAGTLLVPFHRDYNHRSDTGIGLEIGFQRRLFSPYLLLNQSIAHDIYISGHTRFFIGHTFQKPWGRLSAMLGMKYKLFETDRFDQYIDVNESLPSLYATYGIELLLPLIQNGLFMRVEYWDASKRILAAQIGARLYF